MTRKNFERDDQAFPEGAYRVAHHPGVAWRVLGWHTEPTEDTEWSGIEERTGLVVAYMIGDDQCFTFEPEDLSPLAMGSYCAECGQVGCGWGAE